MSLDEYIRSQESIRQQLADNNAYQERLRQSGIERAKSRRNAIYECSKPKLLQYLEELGNQQVQIFLGKGMSPDLPTESALIKEITIETVVGIRVSGGYMNGPSSGGGTAPRTSYISYKGRKAEYRIQPVVIRQGVLRRKKTLEGAYVSAWNITISSNDMKLIHNYHHLKEIFGWTNDGGNILDALWDHSSSVWSPPVRSKIRQIIGWY
jgi:hypothetical protein